MLYSARENAFYHPAIHTENALPPDVVEVPDEEHAALISGQNAALAIGPGANGRPALLPREMPAPSKKELADALARKRDEMLARDIRVDVGEGRVAIVTPSAQGDLAAIARRFSAKVKRVTWRQSTGAFEITQEDFREIDAAASAYLDAVWDAWQALSDGIGAGSVTTFDEIDGAAWPGGEKWA